MGVSASLKAIDKVDLARLSDDNGLVIPFLMGTAPAPSASAKRSFFDRLRGSAASNIVHPFVETQGVTFAGHWEIMTFALSGPNPPKDNPLDLVESDFESFTTIDFGYGPPRLIPFSRMSDFNDAISALADDEIGGRLNSNDLAEAGIYERDEILAQLSDWKAALVQKAGELRAFAQYCAEQKMAALVFFH